MPSPGAENENDKEIVEQLRRLGYLRNPLETFFVGNISQNSSIFKTNVQVGLKVGLVGGLVLGVLIGSGAAILDPRLLQPVTNYLITVAMLSVAYAIIACTLGLVGAVALTLITKVRKKVIPHVRLASIRAGMLGSVVTFIYLTLQWQRLRTAAGAEAFLSLANLGALVVVLAIALLIGKMVSLAVLALVCRLQGVPLHEHAHPARTYAVAAVLTVALISFFVILAITAPNHEPVPAAEYDRLATGKRVVVIGLDGATHNRLTASLDRMPTLRTLARAGSLARLAPSGTRVPASAWTSIATGTPPSVHRVYELAQNKIHGLSDPIQISPADAGFDEAINNILPFFGLAEPVLATTRVKTFWNLASENGLTVGAVNWWLTAPAETVNGFLIGDGAYGAMLSFGNGNGEVTPPELANALNDLTLKPDGVSIPETISQNKLIADAYRTSLAIDRSNLNYALKALERSDRLPDLFALSLSGLDVLEQELTEGGASAAPSLARLQAIADYYHTLDDAVAQIVRRFEDGRPTIFVIVAEPGLRPKTEAAANGFLLLSGDVCNVNPHGEKLLAATVYDVAPTVLYLLGLPKSEPQEMPGFVLLRAIDPEFSRTFAARTITSFGRKERTVPDGDPDRMNERMERLRELGYLR